MADTTDSAMGNTVNATGETTIESSESATLSDAVILQTTNGGGDGDGENVVEPRVVGLIVGVICLVAIPMIVFIFLETRKRKKARHWRELLRKDASKKRKRARRGKHGELGHSILTVEDEPPSGKKKKDWKDAQSFNASVRPTRDKSPRGKQSGKKSFPFFGGLAKSKSRSNGGPSSITAKSTKSP